jgi:MYXO-CTERM domain-containing protein
LVIHAMQGRDSGCSVSASRTPRDGMWWLLALSLLALRLTAHRLSAIATTARRRSRRTTRSRR